MKFQDCFAHGCMLGPLIVEDVEIENLQVRGGLPIYGAVCKHVTLRGRIGQIGIGPYTGDDGLKGKTYRRFQAANDEYYRHVDWALDIREAELSPWASLDGVPGELVRRDPKRHALVWREQAERWRNSGVRLRSDYFPYILEDLLAGDTPGEAIILPITRSGQRGEAERADIELLRDKGLADPD